jgi:hypothetical protein
LHSLLWSIVWLVKLGISWLECRSIEFGFRLFDYLYFSKLANDWLNNKSTTAILTLVKSVNVGKSRGLVCQRGGLEFIFQCC